MDTLACLNGETMPVEQARVPVWDRGFLFGDAVYEVLRLYGGRCWLEADHMARLRHSLQAVELPEHDLARLAERMHRTISASQIQQGTVYLQITRGVSATRHVFPDPPVAPTELIVVKPFDDEPTAQLRRTGVAVASHPDLRWRRCDIKSTNLLANVLASERARRAGCFEAVFVDQEGCITEGTHTSVLWVNEGRLGAPPEGPEILPGLTRRLILRLAETLDVPVVASRITLPSLTNADEVLVVGTTTEVVPVVRVDDRTIGNGKPGPVARRLGEAYRQEVERWLLSAPAVDGLAPQRPGGGQMTTSEASDDPFENHFRREPLPLAGIRIILFTDLPGERAPELVAPLVEYMNELGRPVELCVIPLEGSHLGRALECGLAGAHLPLVLTTTATEPWTRAHIDPLLEAIDHADHVVGRRPARGADRAIRWLRAWPRRLVFAVPLRRRPLSVPPASP